MKKLLQSAAILLTIVILFSRCSVVNKTAGAARSKFVGTWTLSDVSYQGIIGNAVQKVFDQAPPKAFVGSTWQLTNSGNGLYTLTDGTSQSIYWSYSNPGNGLEPMFQFKKVYQGDKVKDVQTGYQLVVGSVDNASMTLKSPIDLGSSKGYVVYFFTKTK
jgi:hypothetical protein